MPNTAIATRDRPSLLGDSSPAVKVRQQESQGLAETQDSEEKNIVNMNNLKRKAIVRLRIIAHSRLSVVIVLRVLNRRRCVAAVSVALRGTEAAWRSIARCTIASTARL